MKPLKALKSPKKRFVPLVSTKAYTVDEQDTIFVVKVPHDFDIDILDGARGDQEWLRASTEITPNDQPCLTLSQGFVLRSAAHQGIQSQLKCLAPSADAANGYARGPAIAAVFEVMQAQEDTTSSGVEKMKDTVQQLLPPNPRVPVPNAKVYYPIGANPNPAGNEKSIKASVSDGDKEITKKKKKKKKRKAK